MFKALGGAASMKKSRLVSQTLLLLLLRLRNIKAWQFSLPDDFKFIGGICARLELWYAEISEQWPTYGTGAKRQIPALQSVTEVDTTIFDEGKKTNHQKKYMVVMGTYLALRDSSEHTKLLAN